MKRPAFGSGPLLLVFLTIGYCQVFAQSEQALELFVSIPSRSALRFADADRLSRAEQVAAADISQQSERVLRWQLVQLNDVDSVVDRKSGTPQKQIRLTVYPGISFVAENTSHVIRDWSMNWHGEIVEGGKGSVEISIVPDEDNQPVAFVNILSDKGDFNIWPTDIRPYSIAAESNRALVERID